jgi:hypothetical protein
MGGAGGGSTTFRSHGPGGSTFVFTSNLGGMPGGFGGPGMRGGNPFEDMLFGGGP